VHQSGKELSAEITSLSQFAVAFTPINVQNISLYTC